MRHVMQQSAKYGDTEQVHVPTFCQNQSEKGGIMAKSKTSKMQSLLITLILVVTALWFGTVVAAEKQMVMDPSTGQMVEAPQYGGTVTYGRPNFGEHTDAWFIGGWATHFVSEVNEKLVIGDWAIERNKYDWLTYDQPFWTLRGQLAEQWLTPDPTTIIVHIRKGVNWHDKAPMKGRALTTKDVEFNFHRIYGLGSGFSEPSPVGGGVEEIVESVTATDSRTVVFKLTRPDVNALEKIFDNWVSVIYPPEVIKQHGTLSIGGTWSARGP